MLRRTALLAAAFVTLVPLVHAYDVPANDGFVTQTIGVLSSVEEQQLEQTLARYQAQTSNEIAILLVDTLSGSVIDDLGVEVGRKWRVGTQKNNGVLILAALQDRAVTIQVGYGLEGAVPDIVAKGIIDEDIIPAFRDGKYFEGLVASIDALQKHIGGEYTAERYEEQGPGLGQFFFLFLFIVFNFLGAFLGRSRSWWMGGVIGGVFGLILTILYTWWLAIPIFVLLGLGFDFLVSRMPRGGGRRGGGFWGGPGGFGGGGSSGGGFGGFSGGSFGGGGASGRW